MPLSRRDIQLLQERLQAAGRVVDVESLGLSLSQFRGTGLESAVQQFDLSIGTAAKTVLQGFNSADLIKEAISGFNSADLIKEAISRFNSADLIKEAIGAFDFRSVPRSALASLDMSVAAAAKSAIENLRFMPQGSGLPVADVGFSFTSAARSGYAALEAAAGTELNDELREARFEWDVRSLEPSLSVLVRDSTEEPPPTVEADLERQRASEGSAAFATWWSGLKTGEQVCAVLAVGIAARIVAYYAGAVLDPAGISYANEPIKEVLGSIETYIGAIVMYYVAALNSKGDA